MEAMVLVKDLQLVWVPRYMHAIASNTRLCITIKFYNNISIYSYHRKMINNLIIIC